MITLISNLFLSGVSILLPMDATVTGTEIELSEIATLSGADQDLLDELGRIEIGRAPRRSTIDCTALSKCAPTRSILLMKHMRGTP